MSDMTLEDAIEQGLIKPLQITRDFEIIDPVKRAYYVTGAEGSGTTMMTEALVAAGCHWEQWHEGLYDDYRFEDMPSPFVFHRSIPHAKLWSTSIDYCGLLQDASFAVCMLFMTRDVNAANLSIEKRGGRSNLHLHREIYRQLGLYLNSVSQFEFVPVSYEAFCLSPGFRKWLFEERLGLTNPVDFEIKYANEKHYEEQ